MAYHEYSHDYNQIFYEAREIMKRDAYSTLRDTYDDAEEFHDERIRAVEQIMKSHFLRSVENFTACYGRRKEHPSFRKFVSMLMDNDEYRHNIVPEDVEQDLIGKYGRIKGIPKGSYYIPQMK